MHRLDHSKRPGCLSLQVARKKQPCAHRLLVHVSTASWHRTWNHPIYLQHAKQTFYFYSSTRVDSSLFFHLVQRSVCWHLQWTKNAEKRKLCSCRQKGQSQSDCLQLNGLDRRKQHFQKIGRASSCDRMAKWNHTRRPCLHCPCRLRMSSLRRQRGPIGLQPFARPGCRLRHPSLSRRWSSRVPRLWLPPQPSWFRHANAPPPRPAPRVNTTAATPSRLMLLLPLRSRFREARASSTS